MLGYVTGRCTLHLGLKGTAAEARALELMRLVGISDPEARMRQYPGAFGTDTAGSIRDPAAWCGVTGLKPTDGLINTAGLLPLSRSMDCIGPMARTARDCALLLQAIGGSQVVPDLPDLTGIRIGLPRAVWQDHAALDPQVAAVAEVAIARFRDLGAVLEEVCLSDFSEMGQIARNISWPEETAEHGAELNDFHDRFSTVARAPLADGRAIPAPE